MVVEETTKSRVHGSFHLLDAIEEDKVKFIEELIRRFGVPIVYSVGTSLYLTLDSGDIVRISKFVFRIDGEDFDEN